MSVKSVDVVGHFILHKAADDNSVFTGHFYQDVMQISSHPSLFFT